jgi:DNA (cytosine-5)-methyltransferase 1
LFAGIGGFRLALERHDLECVFSSEIDKHAQAAYKENFGEIPHGDITEISEKNIPKHDILCAGFPCQPFSISGKKQGISDSRGRLFYEIQRIADHHKPYIMILENVKGILSIDNGNTIKTIEKKIDEIGYTLHKHTLNSSFFGIPQSRERVYFVALRKDLDNKALDYAPPLKTNKKIFLSDIMESDVDKKMFIKRNDIKINKNDSEVENMLKPIRIGIVNKGGQGERIYSTKGHAITQSAYGGGVGAKTGLYNTEQGIRRLTINECKRVMGFPVTYKVSTGVQGYQQLGNAVIPSMIEHIYENIKEIK